ncbi:MAG TPA: hypothetical protein VJQ77_05885 [Novosphingobium sp.]|nr:hypothetical protein [Novosphingobium sp.]
MSYASMDHAGWVESNNGYWNAGNQHRRGFKPRPEKLSAFQAKVIDICGIVGGGIYNAPINWERVEWGGGGNWSGMWVPWRDGRMATFDSYQLTNLVLLAHASRIRVEIQARAKGHMMLSFFQRSHEGSMMERHPSIDEAVAAFRAYLPEDHRVIYLEPADA